MFTQTVVVDIVVGMKKEYEIKKPEDFQHVIEHIFSEVENTDVSNLVILLEGDLGAGKTTFTQILGKTLGVTDVINSPTFTIMKQYTVPDNKTFQNLVHIDAYRIEREEEVRPLKLKETINKKNTIVCVEWPELISSVLPVKAVRIKIEVVDNSTRRVVVSQGSV